eukprot:15445975-Alexandrium_andersonii.AAC.1
MDELAAAVAAHHAALWRLATRAVEAYGETAEVRRKPGRRDVPQAEQAMMPPGLERPPTRERRDDRPTGHPPRSPGQAYAGVRSASGPAGKSDATGQLRDPA